jgi:hypothetical protein
MGRGPKPIILPRFQAFQSLDKVVTGGVPARRNESFSSLCCPIRNIFEPARQLANWSTSRYPFPLIAQIGSLGVAG